MIDPISTKSAKKVTAETYTLGWTSEVRFIQSRAYENQKRKLQNMEPLPPFKRQYKELPPFSGAMKVHIARDQANLEAIDSQPIPDYWVSQLHFVNAVQRNVLTNIGLPSEYENRLRIGLFSPSVDRGHLYCIPYNQMLEAELFKRLEVFFQCVNDGVSPSSPRIKKTFDYYHVDNIQKNLQILPKKIEAMAGQALNQMDLLDQQKIQLDEKKQGFQKVLDRIYSDYTQKTGDIVLLPGNRTLEQREPDGKVNVSLIAQALRRAVNLQESVERLYKMIQNQALDASVVISQLEDMLTTYELDRSLLEGVIENNFSQMAEMAESTEPPLVQVTKTKDSRIYNQLAARRDAIEQRAAQSHPTQ